MDIISISIIELEVVVSELQKLPEDTSGVEFILESIATRLKPFEYFL